jgi:hypothetical protein
VGTTGSEDEVRRRHCSPTAETLTVAEGHAEAMGCTTAATTPTVAARAQIFTDEPVKDVIVEVKVCDLQSYTCLIYS